MFMLYVLLLNNRQKDFLFDILTLEDALKVRMKINYRFTNNILSYAENFPFPEGIENAIHPEKKYHFFEMKVHGLLHLLAKASWYFVYDAEYPYEFIAYFGNSGIKAETIYFLEYETILDKKQTDVSK